jgi:hypothetical protein
MMYVSQFDFRICSRNNRAKRETVICGGGRMDDDAAKVDKTASVTPFSINDILNSKCKDEGDMQEKALDMSKANKDHTGKDDSISFVAGYFIIRITFFLLIIIITSRIYICFLLFYSSRVFILFILLVVKCNDSVW